jgi:uncharacterized protein (TIGR02757 family)
MEKEALKSFLDEKADQFNAFTFIATDPIQVPHQYSDPRDIEIAAFLTAILSWGQKATIISKAGELLSMMQGGPYEFIMESGDEQLEKFIPFVHRTFNGLDCIYFLRALQQIYQRHGGLSQIFERGFEVHGDLFDAIVQFRKIFFQFGEPGRTAKHLADPSKGSSAKRVNMFLRWMVRSDNRGVDFGIWKRIPMGALYIPLDVHTGSVARKLGLLKRKQNDWTAVRELTERLKQFDPADPVRYDYALFGLGSFDRF